MAAAGGPGSEHEQAFFFTHASDVAGEQMTTNPNFPQTKLSFTVRMKQFKDR